MNRVRLARNMRWVVNWSNRVSKWALAAANVYKLSVSMDRRKYRARLPTTKPMLVRRDLPCTMQDGYWVTYMTMYTSVKMVRA